MAMPFCFLTFTLPNLYAWKLNPHTVKLFTSIWMLFMPLLNSETFLNTGINPWLLAVRRKGEASSQRPVTKRDDMVFVPLCLAVKRYNFVPMLYSYFLDLMSIKMFLGVYVPFSGDTPIS